MHSNYQYEHGVRGFIDFAFQHNSINGKAKCPCTQCCFQKWKNRDVVYDHLIYILFPKGYTFWLHHGESRTGETSHGSNVVQYSVSKCPIQNMINDAFEFDRHHANEVPIISNADVNLEKDVMSNVTQEGHKAREYYYLTRDGEQPLYEGCTKYSRFSFLAKLYYIKCLCGISDKAMTMILELLRDAFEHVKILGSFYEAKKMITKLDLNYEKIPACLNNYMLYWGNREDEERETCRICHTSKWKKTKGKSWYD